MLKIVLPILSAVTLANASYSESANSSSDKALQSLDCEFEDCSKSESKPKVIIKERIIR